jgi:hypothetical protein
LWSATAAGLAIVAVFFNHPAQRPAPEVFHGAHAAVDVVGYSSNGTLQEPSNSDIAEVVKALDTRARAVLDDDRAAFLSTVDSDRTAFAAQQRVVWQNTRQLPFEKLSYEFDGLVEPDRPLSTPSFLARVTTMYQLRGFDSEPIQVDDGFTFVQQDGAWKLAGITDADDQFTQRNLPAPWDGGPIVAYADDDYLAIVDRGRLPLARRIVALCHVGSRTSGTMLGVENTKPTVVLATSHTRGFTTFSGPDAEAVSYPLRGLEGTTPGWSVVVNPRAVDDAASSRLVLPHEIAHLATQDYLAYLPAWLAEGAAEYVGWHSQGGLAAAVRLRQYTPQTLPDTLPISAGFYRGDFQLHYVQGLALVSWIEEHRGTSTVLALMRAYAEAGGFDLSFDADTASADILRDQLEMTPAVLARAAYDELNATARSR